MNRPPLPLLLLLLLLLTPPNIQAFAPTAPLLLLHNNNNDIRTTPPLPHRTTTHPHRPHPPKTRTYASPSSDLPDAPGMRVKELRAELDSYGIATGSFFEKGELVDAVEKARAGGAKGKVGAGEGVGGGGAAGASSGGGGGGGNPKGESGGSGGRAARLVEEMERCNSMKVAELRSELASYGISTKSFFEKSEFVKACAEVRVDGTATSGGGGGGGGGGNNSKDEEYDPSYRDVVMQKMSREQAAQMGFGGMGAAKTSTIDVRLG